jgi:hypothetical protein
MCSALGLDECKNNIQQESARPYVKGPLNTLAPEAQMMLARRAAAAGQASDAAQR